jgi:Na+-transporting NADH:ubiquinone oxidoreductase subunit NqrA
MGWMSPGVDRHSVMGIYLSRFLGGRRFAMDTSTNGSPRAIVPIGAYEGHAARRAGDAAAEVAGGGDVRLR